MLSPAQIRTRLLTPVPEPDSRAALSECRPANRSADRPYQASNSAALARLLASHRARRGKAIVFVVVAFPALFGLLGLVIDGGLMMAERRGAQQAADAAATAAALDIQQGNSGNAAATAVSYVRQWNGLAGAQVTVNLPPASGSYQGNSSYVEVIVTLNASTYFVPLIGMADLQTVKARSVAGSEASTVGGAIVVLDPDPPSWTVSGVPMITIPPIPTQYAGLQVPGLGQVSVNGAVLVNTTWGGVDQNGNPAGTGSGPPYGISCFPIVSLTSLKARDIRVVGGVDNPSNYGSIAAGSPSPLKANKLPVPDPLTTLPVPTLSADSRNVSATSYGGVRVIGLPLIGPPVNLHPGVYDWIEVISGIAVFNPGVYIVRGKNPLSQAALVLAGGSITANGVMFYITNSAAYDPTVGAPDDGDGETPPPAPELMSQVPSVVINAALLTSSLTPLTDADSPYDGMLLFQRRADRRPLVFVNEALILGGTIAGTIYAKWGEVIFAGQGTYDLRMAAGSVLILDVLDLTFSPTRLFPPVYEVFLVE
jgi:Flp pilus assembly protein TadG